MHGYLLDRLMRAPVMPFGVSLLALLPLVLAACGGSEPPPSAAPVDNAAEVEAHYRGKASLPPELRAALDSGGITREEVDRRSAAGEFPKFFRQATPADIPADLDWKDGADLPEFASPEAVKGGTHYAHLEDFPRTLRIAGPDSSGSFRRQLFDNLAMRFAQRHPNDTSIGPDGFRYYPGIARQWAVDREGRQVFVRIDPAARWSDGVPITVDDVFFMFYMYQSPHLRDPWFNDWYERTFTHVTRYDDLTFSIGLPEMKPDAAGSVLDLEPVPRHFFREFGADFPERYQWRFAPTSGAYVIRDGDLRKGESVAFSRVEDWWARDRKFWRHRFNPDRLHFRVIRDSNKAFEAFRRGEIDRFLITLPPLWHEQLPDDDPLVAAGYVAKAAFYNEIPRPSYGLWMNQARPLLDDRDIREGLQYATHWDRVIREYFRGDYVRMRTTSDGFGEFTEPTLRPRPYSVDRALDAFARAGFRERGPDGILVDASGRRLSFSLSTGYRDLADVLTILREEAARAGVEYRIELLDDTASWKRVMEKQHDIDLTAFSVAPEMYPRYSELFHSSGAYDQPFLDDGGPNPARRVLPDTNNLLSIADPELDRLIDAYRRSGDLAEMKRLAFEIERRLHADASFSPGFVAPFYRVAYWRWLRWPAEFNAKLTRSADQLHLHWIDEDLKRRVTEARKSGERFPPIVEVHDQYRQP